MQLGETTTVHHYLMSFNLHRLVTHILHPLTMSENIVSNKTAFVAFEPSIQSILPKCDELWFFFVFFCVIYLQSQCLREKKESYKEEKRALHQLQICFIITSVIARRDGDETGDGKRERRNREAQNVLALALHFNPVNKMRENI